jgi:hypothetical protein
LIDALRARRERQRLDPEIFFVSLARFRTLVQYPIKIG